MNEILVIDQSAKTSARDLYEFLNLAPSQYSRWCKTNIEDNEFYQEGTDWQGFDIVSNGNQTKDYRLTIDFAKHLCMLSRSERGKQARNYFVEVEGRYNQLTKLPEMTSAEIVAAIAQNAAAQEKQIQQLTATSEQQGQQIATIRDTIVSNSDDWRKWVNERLNAVAKARGGDYQQVRTESYDLLESRGACLLSVRVNHMKNRLQNAGGTKAQIAAINRLDII